MTPIGYILIAFFTFSELSALAQKTTKYGTISDAFNWSGTLNTNSKYYWRLDQEFATGKNSVIYINSSECVMSVAGEEGIFLLRLNSKGNIIWKYNLNQNVEAFYRVGDDKIVVFTSVPYKGADDAYMIKDITRALIDINSGNILNQSLIYTNTTDKGIQFIGLPDEKGALSACLIRQNDLSKRNDRFSEFEKLWKTQALTLIDFDEDYKITSKTALTSTCLGTTTYLSADADNENNFIITSYDKNNLTYEKFSATGTLMQTLSYPISLRKNTEPVIRTQIDYNEKGALYSILQFENTDKDGGDIFLKTSFSEGKVTLLKQNIYNKDYGKTLQNASVTKKIEYMKIHEFVIAGNNIIIIKSPAAEMVDVNIVYSGNSTSGSALTRDYHSVVIEVYDMKTKSAKTLLLPRYCSIYSYGSMWPGIYVDGNTLHIDYVILNGWASLALKYYTVDLSSMQITGDHFIDEINGIKIYVNAMATLWFKDSFVLQYLQSKHIASKKNQTLLESIDYKSLNK